MKKIERPVRSLLLGVGLSLLGVTSVHAQSVLFWSTQATPVNEQKDVREVVLKSSPVPVEFVTNNDGPYFTRLNAELQKALLVPAVKARLEEMGGEVRGSTSDEMRTMVANQTQKWIQVVNEAKIPKN